MKQRPRIYYTESQKKLMWDHWQKGDSLQHIDDRASGPAVACIALLHQSAQHLPNCGKVGHLLLDQGQFAHGQCSSLATSAGRIKSQQCAHLIQRESQRLRPLDEAQPFDLLR